ncbi:MAG: SMC-Scp complex subunit ScpB [Thermodesulfobacteriota bacterium]|nr:SMC-Scp complex subunit ScpB [Thermodesulfobacteriota bacterium]
MVKLDRKHLKSIIESLIFISETPITINKIREVIDGPDKKTLRALITELIEEYKAMDRGFILSEVAGGYQFRTRPEYAKWNRRLKGEKHLRLSQPAMETLAIIAYKQPITRSEIEYIRGVDVGGILRSLLGKRLIRILGKKEVPGRPLIYGTSTKFLEVFAIKDLTNLPTLQEIEEP